jgi:hypothetical protein
LHSNKHSSSRASLLQNRLLVTSATMRQRDRRTRQTGGMRLAETTAQMELLARKLERTTAIPPETVNELTRLIGQPGYENVSGAGGTVGVGRVARAAPDEAACFADLAAGILIANLRMSPIGSAPRRRESSVEEDSTQRVVD